MMDWTPACLSIDLPPGVVLPARCGGREVALWRGEGGALGACEDRCPHRGMRLSRGEVRGEALVCPFHGRSFDAGGRPLHPPEGECAAAFAVAEAGGVLWLAPAPPGHPPPDLPGLVPLRSLEVEAPAEAFLPGERRDDLGASLPAAEGGPALRLLLDESEGRVRVHALAEPAPPEALVAASRRLDDLRRRAEA